MTDYTPEEQRQLGDAQQAASELRVVGEILDRMRQGALNAIATSTLGEERLREKLYFSVQAIDVLHSALQSAVAAGAAVEYTAVMRELMGDQSLA